ncbi:DsbA family protein [Phreatobacter stygius]|uniref:DsbA family protein n=2 Tax=Phreatobacter stygius TaxID=1940610 RepID=A0A4D7BE06_9HYPH|nr:DsbA family protein [Phreatobacter stygius]
MGSAGLFGLGSPARAQIFAQSPDPAMTAVDVAQLMVPGPLGDCILGAPDAAVTMVEYASATCPHCAHFHITTLPVLKEKFIDRGHMRLVFREFPLNQLDLAAYIFARCTLGSQGRALGDQERYFVYLDALFRRQRDWTGADNPIVALARIAADVGYAQADLEQCLRDQAILDAVLYSRDRAAGRFGVNSTPTFFVNGRKATGTDADLEALIGTLL